MKKFTPIPQNPASGRPLPLSTSGCNKNKIGTFFCEFSTLQIIDSSQEQMWLDLMLGCKPTKPILQHLKMKLKTFSIFWIVFE